MPAGTEKGAGYPGPGVTVVVNLSLLEEQPVLSSAEPRHTEVLYRCLHGHGFGVLSWRMDSLPVASEEKQVSVPWGPLAADYSASSGAHGFWS